jgi:methyl-accepting chemotaxis protein
MNLTIRQKIFMLSFISSLIPIVLISLLIVYKQKEVVKEQSSHLLENANNELGKSAQGIYDMLDIANLKINQQLNSGLKIADEIIKNSGGFQITKNKLSWKAINQFTKTTLEIDLPEISIGKTPFNQIKSFDSKVPLIDRSSEITGSVFTVFQRMNDAGDMLRIATSVKGTNGERAIGTYIPAIMPDGSQNSVLQKVLAGESFRGNAFVVNAWYMTAYNPIKDENGKVIGMLFNGIKQEEDQTIRKSIMSIKAGQTGYVWVIGTKKDQKG